MNKTLISKEYDDIVISKPWGYEYVVYRNKNNLSVTLLNIEHNKSTSLHCHPNKKSGFVLINGKAQFQLGLRKKNTEIHSSPSKRMIARGLFHSIKSLSPRGLTILEFETPVDKNDLVRFKDNYGRVQLSYESKNNIKKLDNPKLKFNLPKTGVKKYFMKNIQISIENHRDFKKLVKNKVSTIFAILDGSVTDVKGRTVLSYGDIVKTEDFKILSKVFKIKSKITLAKITKYKEPKKK